MFFKAEAATRNMITLFWPTAKLRLALDSKRPSDYPERHHRVHLSWT